MHVDLSRLSWKSVVEHLRGWAPEGAAAGSAAAEMDGYIRHSAGRLAASARALATLPRGARVLEIGAHPYFLTVLMRSARPDLDWVCTNWNEACETDGPFDTFVAKKEPDETIPVRWYRANVERHPLPFPDESFDAVVYCEVLEHLYEDPARSLEHIHRVLKPGGEMLLTTPNPARIWNLWCLVSQGTIYDSISGYGIYGRHNREYGKRELIELLEGTGFEVTRCTTVETTSDRRWRGVVARLGYGEHHLLVAKRKSGPSRTFRPDWLYRSFH